MSKPRFRVNFSQSTLKAVLVGVQQEVKAENQKEYYDVLHAPYVQGFSESLQRKLKRFQVGYVPKLGETLYNKLCRLKQTVELEDWKDVVYAIGCDTCGVHYVGQPASITMTEESNIKGM